MKSLVHRNPNFFPFHSFHPIQTRTPSKCRNQVSFPLTSIDLNTSSRWKRSPMAISFPYSSAVDDLGLLESEIQSPAISTSYRSPELPKPNPTVLEAQARVCTGPTQTRPLGEEQACKVLDTILRSGESPPPFCQYLFGGREKFWARLFGCN